MVRRDLILAVQAYNTELKTVPGVLWNKILYADRVTMQQLQIEPEKMDVPKVDFGTTGN